MILYIIRHAWAEDRNEQCWPDDSQRPLTKQGRKRFSRLMKKLAKVGFAPKIIATSPFLRCKETAELIAGRVDGTPEIMLVDALAPGSNLEALVQWTADHQEEQVAWVGHAPDVDQLTAQLIGDGNVAVRFAKGAVAAIRFDAAVQPGTGHLQWMATAKLLDV